MPHRFNSIQFKSQGKRYGDTNADHVIGVQIICEVLEEMKYMTETKFSITDQSFYWEYDVIGYLLDSKLNKIIKFIIEVDGKKHSSMPNKIKDAVAKGKAMRHYPNAKFFRFEKRDCRPEYKPWLIKQLSK